MTRSEYEQYLYDNITEEEWKKILSDPSSLVISDHNLKVLNMLYDSVHGKGLENLKVSANEPAEKPGSDQQVDMLRAEKLLMLLKKYLDIYMPDKPQGHKWIQIASLHLVFVLELPMHPIDRIGIQKNEERGRIIYLCPAKDRTKGSICEYCVCESLS